MRLVSALSLCLFVAVQSADGQSEREAAVRGQATAAGVSQLIDALGPVLMDELLNANIEDMSGTSKVTLVGKIDWKLSKIDINAAEYEAVAVDMPGYIRFAIDRVRIRLNTNWEFQKSSFPWIPFGSGGARVTISKSDIKCDIQTGITDDGQPTAHISNIQVNLRDLDMTITGSWFSWLYNFLIWLFDGIVKSAIRSVIQDDARVLINEFLKEASEQLELMFPIDDGLVLDYSLTEAPDYVEDPTSVVLALRGEFHNPNTDDSAPFPHADFNEHDPIPRMARVWLDQYLLNSYLYTMYESGRMVLTITDGTPVDIPFGLNTAHWMLIIPRLYAKYPNRDLQLVFTVPDHQPLVTISEDHAELNGVFNVAFNADAAGDPKNPVWEEAFVLNGTGAAAVSAEVISTPEESKILLKAHHADLDLDVLSTNIGEFDTSQLQFFIQKLVDEILIPLLNLYLEAGIELPQFNGLTLTNAEIHWHDMFLAIDTDVTYEIPDVVKESIRSAISAHHATVAGGHTDDDSDHGVEWHH